MSDLHFLRLSGVLYLSILCLIVIVLCKEYQMCNLWLCNNGLQQIVKKNINIWTCSVSDPSYLAGCVSFGRILIHCRKRGSGSAIPGSGSADPDPHQNKADSKHWFEG